jgi:hypothetical protein
VSKAALRHFVAKSDHCGFQVRPRSNHRRCSGRLARSQWNWRSAEFRAQSIAAGEHLGLTFATTAQGRVGLLVASMSKGLIDERKAGALQGEAAAKMQCQNP